MNLSYDHSVFLGPSYNISQDASALTEFLRVSYFHCWDLSAPIFRTSYNHSQNVSVITNCLYHITVILRVQVP